MKRVRNGLFLTLTAFAVGAIVVSCGGGDDGTGIQPPPPPPDNGNGSGVDSANVSGVIDTLTARAPFLATVAPRSGMPGQQGAPNPDSVFAGTPRTNGNIEVESKAEITDPDEYSVNVAAGRQSLIIAIAPPPPNSDSIHVGRVLVFARTTPDGQIVTEPVNMETTLEGGVFMRANFGEFTIPRGLLNNPQIGLVHRLSDEVARPAATDTLRVRNIALAFKRAQETMIRSFRSGMFGQAFDSTALNAALRSDAAQPYADARAGGTAHQDAHDQFIQDAAAVYADQMGDTVALAISWGAFGTKHDYMMADAGDDARLPMAQNILAITTGIRRTLLASVPDGTAGKTEVSDALTAILDAGMAAGDMATFKSDVAAARDAGATDLINAVGAIDQAAIDAADLGAFIDASLTPAEIAFELHPAFRDNVEAEESDAANQRLLVALMVGPGYQ